MAKTVDEGFRVFHGWLTPTKMESEAAKNHRASIEACLKNNFGLIRFFRTGSFGNGTSIRGFSDVDYFASIPRDKLKQNSSVSLREVKDVLDRRFPNTGVRVSSPAVVVPFGTDVSETTEVVPADFVTKNADGHHVYDIADGGGGWMKASPDSHNAYVAHADKERGNKVKPLVRFLKAWKYYLNVPISSFYLELRTAKYALNEQTIIYSIDLEHLFSFLLNQGLPAIQDPMGISGYVSACDSEVKKSDALSKLQTAASRAAKAREAEANGKIKEAFYWWNLLFSEQFPVFG